MATRERVCAEFVSRDQDPWAYWGGVVLDYSQPGKPTDNDFTEAFKRSFWAECLNARWFTGLADAREKLDAWRRCYNEERPRGAIGYKCPITLMNPDGRSGRPSA